MYLAATNQCLHNGQYLRCNHRSTIFYKKRMKWVQYDGIEIYYSSRNKSLINDLEAGCLI